MLHFFKFFPTNKFLFLSLNPRETLVRLYVEVILVFCANPLLLSLTVNSSKLRRSQRWNPIMRTSCSRAQQTLPRGRATREITPNKRETPYTSMIPGHPPGVLRDTYSRARELLHRSPLSPASTSMQTTKLAQHHLRIQPRYERSFRQNSGRQELHTWLTWPPCAEIWKNSLTSSWRGVSIS